MTIDISSKAFSFRSSTDSVSMALQFCKNNFLEVANPNHQEVVVPVSEAHQKLFDIFCTCTRVPKYKLDEALDSLLQTTRSVVFYLLTKREIQKGIDDKTVANAIEDEVDMQKNIDSYNANGRKMKPCDESETTVTLRVAGKRFSHESETTLIPRATRIFFSRRQAIVVLAVLNALDSKV